MRASSSCYFASLYKEIKMVHFNNMKQAATLSAVLGFFVFCNSLGLQFCLDDNAAIVKNTDLLGNASWLNLLKNDFWGKEISDVDSHKSYRPLTVATFRLNYMLHELQPLGYHLVNVLLHSAVCYLYVLLCGVVFSEVWPALIAGLLFAVHPVHTEAVSGVVGRAELMCALFTITSLFCYRKCLKTRNNVIHVLWFAVALVSTLCAALCKEIGITATLLCLAYEIILHRHKAHTIKEHRMSYTETLQSCVARAIFLGLFSLAFYWMRVSLNQAPPIFHVDNNPAMEFPTPLRQLHWSYLCVLNVWLLLSPSQLCAEYAMDTIPPIASLTDPRNLLTLTTFVTLLSMTCYAMSTRDGHHRKLLFGLCLMSIPFLPASNLFFPVGFVIAERVLYIPSMGFCMIVAYGAWRLLSSTKHSPGKFNLTKSTIIFLLLTLSMKTYTRNWDWENNLTLFTSALKISKTSAKMWDSIGSTYHKTGSSTLAKSLFLKTLEIEPLYVSAHINLVRVLKAENNYSAAIEHASRASQLVMQGMNGENPHYHKKDKKVFLELAGLLLIHTNRYEEALKWSIVAVEQLPEWERVYEIMGKILLALRKYHQAKLALTKALELKEDYAGAHAGIGETHLELGELVEAESHLRRAIALDSQDFMSQFQLVKLILDHSATHTIDRLTEALDIAHDILAVKADNGNVTLSIDNGNVTLAIALLYQKLGETSQAVQYLEKTTEISPDHYYIHMDRGRLLYDMKIHEEAEQAYAEYERQAPNATDELEFLLLRGANYIAMNDLERALDIHRIALAVDSENEHIRANYGVVLLRTAQYREALELFRKLAEQYPNNAMYSKQVTALEDAMT